MDSQINYFTNLLNQTIQKISIEQNPEIISSLENEKYNYLSIIKNLTQQQNYNNFMPIYGDPEELLQCTLCNLTFKRIDENYVHTFETCTRLQIEKLKQIIIEKDMIINKLQKENEILNIENNEYLNKINLLYDQNQSYNNQLTFNNYKSNIVNNKKKNINEYEIKGLRNKNKVIKKNISLNHLSNTYYKSNNSKKIIIDNLEIENKIKKNPSLKNNNEKKNKNLEDSTTMKSHRKFKSNYQDSFENYLDSNFAQSNNNNNNNDWDELLSDTIVKKNNCNEELKKE
jgi:hypothetical protein